MFLLLLLFPWEKDNSLFFFLRVHDPEEIKSPDSDRFGMKSTQDEVATSATGRYSEWTHPIR